MAVKKVGQKMAKNAWRNRGRRSRASNISRHGNIRVDKPDPEEVIIARPIPLHLQKPHQTPTPWQSAGKRYD